MSRSAGDDEFHALFDDDLEPRDIDHIKQIKNNDPNCKGYPMSADAGEALTCAAWERLGTYIAANHHLQTIDMAGCDLDDSKTAALFGGLTTSSSLREIDISSNGFGLNGIRRMAPFLKSCPNLSHLRLGDNEDISTECFDLLLESLGGCSIKTINAADCEIESLVALGKCALPKLCTLDLNGNRIAGISSQALANYTHLEDLDLSFNHDLGEGAFHAIANLLREQDCSLKCLDVRTTGMNDAGAIVLADALKRNNKLATLIVGGNDIGEKGMGAFLRLLNDVSSIKSTESSNHTLRDFGLSHIHMTSSEMRCVHNALAINEEHDGDPEAAGKAKVWETQLCARARKKLCDLQGIECPSYHQLFSDLDPVLLPDFLQLLDENNDERNELYPAIVAKAADLVSLIDREAMLRGEKAKNEAKIASLSAQIAAINAKMAALQDANARIDTTLYSIELAGNEGSQSSGTEKE